MADLEKRSRDLGKINPSGFVVFRGGGWIKGVTSWVRVSLRFWFEPAGQGGSVSFRVAQRGWIL